MDQNTSQKKERKEKNYTNIVIHTMARLRRKNHCGSVYICRWRTLGTSFVGGRFNNNNNENNNKRNARKRVQEGRSGGAISSTRYSCIENTKRLRKLANNVVRTRQLCRPFISVLRVSLMKTPDRHSDDVSTCSYTRLASYI